MNLYVSVKKDRVKTLTIRSSIELLMAWRIDGDVKKVSRIAALFSTAFLSNTIAPL
jgi:hypothetical protein